MFGPFDLLTASSEFELQLVVILTLIISSAHFSRRNLSASGLVIFVDFLRQHDKFAFYIQSKYAFHRHLGTLYPIDSVANIVNGIKEDKNC